ncbi:hypothetical protein GL2_21850 [Microbulbifer sp. GL-2]|nr:hypothetical protein GL2_21850 [Microbulbifer sp. GL-2]
MTEATPFDNRTGLLNGSHLPSFDHDRPCLVVVINELQDRLASQSLTSDNAPKRATFSRAKQHI